MLDNTRGHKLARFGQARVRLGKDSQVNWVKTGQCGVKLGKVSQRLG